MEKKLRVAGSVIGELSDKIPSNIIALNELIKNSYDAGAKEVSIVLDTGANKLMISDDGDGMDDLEIDILLHVSKSSKKYGSINPKTGRYIQGSKGLGFLSVFKFGDIVTWTTIKDKQKSFTINYQDILNLEDVSDYTVSITEESKTLETGTLIEMILRNDYNSNQLKDYLLNQMNRDKILNSFIDNEFIIKLEVDGRLFQTKECLSLVPYYTENQLFQLSFSSVSKQIHFLYKNHYKYGKTANTEKVILYNSNIDSRFKLSLELMIFDFTKTKRKNDPDQLFIVHPNKLTPLIYINKNFFNNFSLFDPELLRYSQNTISLPQMIGYIEIISDNKDIQFNSDRTQFQENELTESIRETLEDINRLIQKSGSEFKLEIKKSNMKKSTPPPLQSKEKGASPNDKNLPYDGDNGGTEIHSFNFKPVVLDVRKQVTLIAPTGQIDLRNYIQHTEDSRGQAIDFSKIEIKVDDILVKTGIIESINDICRKNIIYFYDDPQTGQAINNLQLNIVQAPLKGQERIPVLIPNKGSSSYRVNFKENPIVDLVNQLDKLYSDTKISYSEVIACSLRALFELSIYELEMAELVKFKKSRGYKEDILKGKIVNLVSAILSDNNLIGTILIGLGRSDYQQFINELNSTDFEKAIKKCHLGAHKSTSSLTEEDISFVGNVAGLFLAIVSELLNNANINWPTLGKPWEIEIK